MFACARFRFRSAQCAGLGALMFALASLACSSTNREHVLLIVVDTLRRDHVSAFGGVVQTPNIDALAERGQVFPDALASFHQTSMSMAAMFTGRTPSIETGDPTKTLPWNSSTWCGMARFASSRPDETCIPRSLTTLPERLQDGGFWTMGVTSNQFLYEPSGFGRGFDDWTEVDARRPLAGPASWRGIRDTLRTRAWPNVNAAAFRAVDAAPEGRRLFLYVHYLDVHDYHLYDRGYAESVALMDGAIGELLAGLEERGFLQRSVVVFVSDHGERLGEDHNLDFELPRNYGHYGNPSFNEVLEIPLIVAPAVLPEAEHPVRTQDLFHLVQEIAGLEAPRQSDLDPDELFVGEMSFRTYRKGRWKTSIRRRDGKAFLYDLEADADEQTNVAPDVRLQVLAHRLRANELSQSLMADSAPQPDLSSDDEARLRSLGYLE